VVHLAARSQSHWSLALLAAIITLACDISAWIFEDNVTSPLEGARKERAEENIVSVRSNRSAHYESS
jgi:hypothetical protein